MSLLDNNLENNDKPIDEFTEKLIDRIESEVFFKYIVEINGICGDLRSQISVMKNHIKYLEDYITSLRLEIYDDSEVQLREDQYAKTYISERKYEIRPY